MNEIVSMLSTIFLLAFTLFVALATLKKRYRFVALIVQGKVPNAFGIPLKVKKNIKLKIRKSLKFVKHVLIEVSLEIAMIFEVIVFNYGSPLLIIVSLICIFAIELLYLKITTYGKLKNIFKDAEIYICKDHEGKDKYIVNYMNERPKKISYSFELALYGIIITISILLIIFTLTKSTTETVVDERYVVNDVLSIPVGGEDGSESDKLYYFNCTDENGETFSILLNEDEIDYIIPDSKQTESYLLITTTTKYAKSEIYLNEEYSVSNERKTYSFCLMPGGTLKSIDELLEQ